MFWQCDRPKIPGTGARVHFLLSEGRRLVWLLRQQPMWRKSRTLGIGDAADPDAGDTNRDQ
jgi:hypothetical protein